MAFVVELITAIPRRFARSNQTCPIESKSHQPNLLPELNRAGSLLDFSHFSATTKKQIKFSILLGKIPSQTYRVFEQRQKILFVLL